jgi:hypothetical protein
MRWYAPPALLVDGQVGVAGDWPCADAWPLEREAMRGVYRHPPILLPDGGPGIVGGSPHDVPPLEVLEAGIPRYPRMHLLTDASSEPRMSLPPSAARSVFSPARER